MTFYDTIQRKFCKNYIFVAANTLIILFKDIVAIIGLKLISDK